MRAVDQMEVWVIKIVRAQMKTNANIVPAFRGVLLRLFRVSLDNLVNPLSGEIVMVGNFSQRLTVDAQVCNFRISRSVWLWAWLERAPGPAGNVI